MFDSIRVDLDNCFYYPELAQSIIYFHDIFRQGYHYGFDNNDGTISVYFNGAFFSKLILVMVCMKLLCV